MSETLVVNEIYLSLQGESSFAGWPCIFIRLTACNLRCSYCDTAYAFTQGKKQSLEEIFRRVKEMSAPFDAREVSETPESSPDVPGAQGPFDPLRAGPRPSPAKLPLVELTGGEPLLQPNVLPLMRQLCDTGYTVLLETSGAHDIAPVDPRVRRIMDLKCPSSGEVNRNHWDNLAHLRATDEIKFVIGTEEDYAWAKEQIRAHQLHLRCPLLISWVSPLTPEQQDRSLRPVPAGQTPISRRELAERIVADALPVRFQVQMHKVIWPADQRGV
jgi:7-carboxy-7-deazaguanine synthase